MKNTLLPAVAPDENERLKELYLYEILDTSPEKDFDELVELASQVCGCSIAAISFIDENRQWFKAIKGDEHPKTARETSFCSHTILDDGPFIIEDASKDARFADSPDVAAGLNIRFYAGIPIYSIHKKRLGAVCVIDTEPRSLNKTQLAVLELVSRQVSHLLELRLRNKLLVEYSRKALQNVETSFETFFNQAGIPKWIYEFETLRFLQVNEAVVKKYGYTREEMLNMTVFDIRTEKEKKKFHELVQSVRQDDQLYTFKSVHQTKDHRRINVEVTVTDIVYMGKAARLATIVDITERERLKMTIVKDKKKADQKIKEAALNAREDERDHIGKELHDNINQILASTKLFLEVAEGYEDMRMDMITRSKDNIIEAIKEVRFLSHTLTAPLDRDFKLKESIRELVDSYVAAHTFNIQVNDSPDIEQLPEDLKINIYRILQEQFSNIAKYAEASEVLLSFEMADNVLIRIEDNGKGFDTSAKRDGIGLNNISKRVDFYKGNFEFSSSPGEGTMMVIQIPLNPISPK